MREEILQGMLSSRRESSGRSARKRGFFSALGAEVLLFGALLFFDTPHYFYDFMFYFYFFWGGVEKIVVPFFWS